MKASSRRQFIFDSAKISLVTFIAPHSIASIVKSNSNSILPITSMPDTVFKQTPLPYTYNALEPWIDAETMDIHYNKHAAAYCKNLNEAVDAEKASANMSLEDILASVSKFSKKMQNNAGGHYNHEMFWKSMTPNGTAQPKGSLLAGIEKNFTSFDNFKNQFNEAGKTRFGSGWAWMIVTSDKKLMITSTPNQNNTLMDIADVKGFPLLGLDVWEHAYYLKYQYKRAEYIDNFWKIINWDYIQQRFDSVA